MPALLETLADAILPIERPHPVRVAIDGRSAAGKTTFSAALAERLAASGREIAVVHLDDYHPVGYRQGGGSAAYTPERYIDEGFDFAAFQRDVLEPTRPGGSGAVAFALAGVFDDAPECGVVLGPGSILIVDGAFLLKPDLRGWWDYAIWLDVSFETMIRRAVGRDVAWVGDAEQVRRRYATFWTTTHALYEAMGPREAADAIVDNQDPAAPRLVRSRPSR